MYVYVTKFEGKPGLLKIGKSVSPITRNSTLSGSHGPILCSDHYKIGKEYATVEKYLHHRYSEHREKTSGDGGTEFFSDSVHQDVSNYLSKYLSEDYQLEDEDFIKTQLKLERKRYYNLIGKLLGYKYSELHTGDYHSSYTGMWSMMKIEACYSLGFDPFEICSRYIYSVNDDHPLTRFTTPGRVALAYKLHKQGTTKEKSLQELLTTVIERGKKFL